MQTGGALRHGEQQIAASRPEDELFGSGGLAHVSEMARRDAGRRC